MEKIFIGPDDDRQGKYLREKERFDYQVTEKKAARGKGRRVSRIGRIRGSHEDSARALLG